MTATEHEFTRGIIEFGSDVRFLLYRARFMSAKEFNEEVQRKRRILQKVYRKAEIEGIDLAPHYNALAEIQANLKIAQAGLYENGAAQEKIALFIDGSNLNAMAYDRLRTKVDFEKLLNYFSEDALILHAYYYLAVNKDDPTMQFLGWLRLNGYQLVTKPLKEYDDGGQKGNLDIEIALDMLELAGKVDRAVLFSGDGDFAPLLKKVGSRGTRTHVVSYWGYGEGPTAPELLEAADIFTELKELLPRLRKAEP